ncbi:metallophosphoesterase [Roseimaritima ulvae]|uniref:PhoD-like phosphatase n=1 Tax=Roseimaritima ulvae TaxID=980254 RepID=A0A5B9QGM5_9BACT|nr:metallophosphoesterase [Roseimaritima ulvae]QEG38188.1 PhoD-like phosphatase [Roseimaritima ulvae]
MRYQWTMFAVAIAACWSLLSITAFAQQGRLDPVVKAIDTNRDGSVSSTELKSAAASLRKLDLDGNGTVSLAEASARTDLNQGRGGGSRASGSRLGGYTTPPAANDVPSHPFNVIVGRLTDVSATVRVLFHSDVDACLIYGGQTGKLSSKTKVQSLKAGQPFDFVIDSLEKNTRYFYRVVYQSGGHTQESDEFRFHTQRDKGSSFVFTVQADSHLDENTSGEVYLRTLSNALADQPDFHFALGDTFMTGKYVRPEIAEPQYLAQRYYLGQLCHSAALYFALGNHDGESGNRGSNVWATTMRKRHIPNPFPNGFFTGNKQEEREVGLPENYYQFEWGDAQFIVLDPFRHTTKRNRGREGDNWNWTLGENQYRWLKQSLEQSDAKLRFVFIHHLVGGANRNNRGGAEAAPFWEWGGQGLSGEDEFQKNRPGRDKPIHQMLVDHGVSVVFHGHDHMFIKQDLDGIVYQLVPQPGHPRSGTKSAQEYGYLGGEIQGSSGHVRVRVSGDSARVDYVRAYLPAAERGRNRNGDVSYSYMLSK